MMDIIKISKTSEICNIWNLYGESSLVTEKRAALCKDDIKTKIDQEQE